ncbi:hypothetical protein [Isoptericola croceus]|uniref:hypothetical protein n=1 Tax=Isoptericola croceus TaxID=3031406 RepID=UPI0023F94A4A|nr:hypothetical protein [Isoptericola croceus]
MKIKTKRVGALCALALAVTALAGCTGEPEPESTSPPASASLPSAGNATPDPDDDESPTPDDDADADGDEGFDDTGDVDYDSSYRLGDDVPDPPEGMIYVLNNNTSEYLLHNAEVILEEHEAAELYGWDSETFVAAARVSNDFVETLNTYSAESWLDDADERAAQYAIDPMRTMLLDRAEHARAIGDGPSAGFLDSDIKKVNGSADSVVLYAEGYCGTVDETHAVALASWRTITAHAGSSSNDEMEPTATATYLQVELTDDGWKVSEELEGAC